MDTTSLILKRDSRGRVRTPPEQREALLEEFGRSGLSARKFSVLAGVRCQTFATWVQQKRRKEAVPAARNTGMEEPKASGVAEATMRLVEAVCGEDRGANGVRIELPGGATVELRHASQAVLVATLLRSLAISSVASC